MNEHDPIVPRDVSACLAALPRELPPQRDLWIGIDAAIAADAPPVHRRSYALAAAAAVVALGALVGIRLTQTPVAPAADAIPSGSLALARHKSSADVDYRATRVALERTYRERLAMLAPKTRARIEEDLSLIRQANEDIARALTQHPADALLMELLQSTTEQEFDLYARVGRNTEPLAVRTRT